MTALIRIPPGARHAPRRTSNFPIQPLATDTGYCAFVASRRKAAKVKEELVESGCDAIRVNAIRAPAGIDITAVTPEEVAVSILGEMIQFRRASLAQAQANKMATAKAMDNDETKVIVDVVSQASCGDPEGE